MADFLSPAERSRRMSRIASKNTVPEIALRKALHRRGFRFRINDKKLPGKPDIVLPKYHAVIFVHGCFWHRHGGCKVATTPKSNTAFWIEKFDRNVKRDAAAAEQLLSSGWNVIVAWECELDSNRKAEAAADRISGELRAKQ
jgi:DNA mismatch endonuclease (patch repair protein)